MVSVGTYRAWETAATLPSAGAAVGSAARGATAPTRGGEGRGHIVSPRAQLFIFVSLSKERHIDGYSCKYSKFFNHSESSSFIIETQIHRL